MLDNQLKHNIRCHINAAIASLRTAAHYAKDDEEILDYISLDAGSLEMTKTLYLQDHDETSNQS